MSLASQFPARFLFPKIFGAGGVALAMCLLTTGRCEAGCGDYLVPPVWILKQIETQREFTLGRRVGTHQQQPCTGPTCRRNSVPQPNEPVVLIVTAVPQSALLVPEQCEEHRDSPGLGHTRPEARVASGDPQRIERPPTLLS